MTNFVINMLPLPDSTYPNATALMKAVRDFEYDQGHMVSKLHSDKIKIVIECDRCGTYISRVASHHKEKENLLPD